jgi:hypothetical protein
VNNPQFESYVDRAELIDLTYRYAAGVDLLDRDAYRSCFTEPVEIDFGSFDDEAVKVMSTEEWIDYCWHHVEGLDSSQHIITNHRIAFDETDKATIVAYLHGQHYLEDAGGYILSGYYTYGAVRTPEGWRISRVQFTKTWDSGDPVVFELGRERLAQGTASRSRPQALG